MTDFDYIHGRFRTEFVMTRANDIGARIDVLNRWREAITEYEVSLPDVISETISLRLYVAKLEHEVFRLSTMLTQETQISDDLRAASEKWEEAAMAWKSNAETAGALLDQRDLYISYLHDCMDPQKRITILS